MNLKKGLWNVGRIEELFRKGYLITKVNLVILMIKFSKNDYIKINKESK